MEERFQFDLQFLKRFLRILGIIFPRCCSATVLLFFLLFCVLVLQQVVVYNVGMLPSKYYVVLGNKDFDGFMNHTVYSLILVVSIAFIYATQLYLSSVFYVTSRHILTKTLHKSYLQDICYYQVNVLDELLDNPDQRITQDVDKLCSSFSSISAKILIGPFVCAYYMYNTWYSTGYIGPLCVLGFFILSTILNKLLMSPVVSLVYKQERLEGDFRFKHMLIRSNAESAAFYRSGRLELHKCNQKLAALIKTQNRLMLKEYILNFFIKLADYIGSILSYIILAIPIFAGNYDNLTPADLSGLISKNAFVTIYLIYSFTSLIDLAATVTDLAGVTHRVAQLVECLGEWRVNQLHDTVYSGLSSPAYTDSNTGPPADQNLRGLSSPAYMDSQSDQNVAYKLRSVTYGPPNQQDKILVKDVSFEVVRGRSLLITGDSGCGKSSLLRVLDGLWPCMSGHVERRVTHGHSGVLYLPQKPALTEGSLREQIIYPYKDSSTGGIEDQEILENLSLTDLMGLYHRAGGLDVQVDWNWYDMLSPGEMQRLSFVRLFYHRPPFAVMDEATSQVSLDMERVLYERCCHLGITAVSVGHRDSLRRYHQLELHLSGDQSYTLQEINDDHRPGSSPGPVGVKDPSVGLVIPLVESSSGSDVATESTEVSASSRTDLTTQPPTGEGTSYPNQSSDVSRL